MQSLRDKLLLFLVNVKATLFHEQVEGGEVFIFEVDCGLWQVLIDREREEVHVGRCVALDALQKLDVLLGTWRVRRDRLTRSGP